MTIEASVLLSGGIDSTACAHLLQKHGYAVGGVFLDYGQGAARAERRAVQAISTLLGIPLRVYEVRGHVSFAAGELVGRNAFLIFSALFLSPQKRGLLGLGIHYGTPYYDCSPAFVESMRKIVANHTDGALQLTAPFMWWTKSDVFAYFTAEGLPLDLTYSCEASSEAPCGACASCRDRELLRC